MMFLLDTNAFSDLMRKHLKLDAHLSSLAPAVLVTAYRPDPDLWNEDFTRRKP
jgi:predicted nucleic acid-binding protein